LYFKFFFFSGFCEIFLGDRISRTWVPEILPPKCRRKIRNLWLLRRDFGGLEPLTIPKREQHFFFSSLIPIKIGKNNFQIFKERDFAKIPRDFSESLWMLLGYFQKIPGYSTKMQDLHFWFFCRSQIINREKNLIEKIENFRKKNN